MVQLGVSGVKTGQVARRLYCILFTVHQVK